MTKQEAAWLGTREGATAGAKYVEDVEHLRIDAQLVKATVNTLAYDLPMRPVSRIPAEAFHVAFVNEFMAVWTRHYNTLPEVVEARRLDKLRRTIDSTSREADGKIERFTSNLRTNPAYAFEWSDTAFQAAATLDVNARVTNMLNSDLTIDAVQKELIHEVVTGSRHPSHSTSQPSNLMQQYKLAVLASLLAAILDN